MPQPDNAPAGPRPWYHVGPVTNVAAAAAGDDGSEGAESTSTSADVYVYDIIGGWWGLTADDFVRDVASLDVDTIVLHLNTPGGEVSEGTAIANMLRQHRATVRVMVDGMAASSGSVIAMAGDEVVMGVGSQMMIHNPSTWAVGDADEMTKVARMLESTADAIASTYAARAGGTVAEWRTVMKAETWYTAEEAVTAGLADRVADDDDKATASGKQVTPGANSGFWSMWDSLRAQDRLDLSGFAYQGRAKAPAPKLPAARPSQPSTPAARDALATAAKEAARIRAAVTKKTPVTDPVGGPSTTTKGAAEMQFTEEERTELRARFNLAADADDDAIKAALLAPPTTPPDTNDTTAAAPSQKTSGALPPGMRLISDSAWQAQQDRIKRLEARETKRERDERDTVVAQAVKDGKFTVAQKDHFVKLWDKDPEGTRNLIASLQKGVVPTGELGYAAGGDEQDETFAEFDAMFPPHLRLAGKGA